MDTTRPRTTARPPAPRRSMWIFLLVIVLAGAWIGVWQRERLFAWFDSRESDSDSVVESRELDPIPGPEQEFRELNADAESTWLMVAGRVPDWPAGLVEGDENSCVEIQADWDAFCSWFEAEGASSEESPLTCDWLLGLIARAESNLPPIDAGLRDLPSLVKGVRHLYLAWGEQDLLRARDLLMRDRAVLESSSLTVVRWLRSREACGEAEPIGLAASAHYARFLFSTVGGQAYLRRRSPDVESLVGYYGLVMLDEADKRGLNSDGYDLSPEIRRTRELISRTEWRFRGEYLDSLDQMRDRWLSKTRGGVR